jgi:hypothetical protein
VAAGASLALAGLGAIAFPEHRDALIVGLAASFVAALAGAVPLALEAGIAAAGKAAAARLLVGLAAIGGLALWGPWERRVLLLGFAAGYVVLMAVESWAVLRLLPRPSSATDRR